MDKAQLAVHNANRRGSELEERVGSAGITVNSTVKVDTITEKTSDAGVTIEGVTLKDGAVVGAVDIGLVIALG